MALEDGGREERGIRRATETEGEMYVPVMERKQEWVSGRAIFKERKKDRTVCLCDSNI